MPWTTRCRPYLPLGVGDEVALNQRGENHSKLTGTMPAAASSFVNPRGAPFIPSILLVPSKIVFQVAVPGWLVLSVSPICSLSGSLQLGPHAEVASTYRSSHCFVSEACCSSYYSTHGYRLEGFGSTSCLRSLAVGTVGIET